MAANPRDVLIRPLVTEKSSGMMQDNKYTFEVALKATKSEVKAALKSVFSVDVIKINTSILRGKHTRKARSKRTGPIDVKSANTKKAFVRLKQGQELPVPSLQEAPAEGSK